MISLRLTPDERERVQRQAGRAGYASVSAFVRDRALHGGSIGPATVRVIGALTSLG